MRQSERDANHVTYRIEKEAWEGGGEVEVPRRSTPVGGLRVDNVIAEGGEFGPKRKVLPEDRVDRDSKDQTNEGTSEAATNY